MNLQLQSIETILDRYPRQPRYLISLLQDVQSEYNFVSSEAMDLVCDYVGVPTTQAWSVLTFYKSFSLEPRGEHQIKVCQGTACHLKGSERLVENLSRDLGIEPGETTSDLRFTLETVNCLGACALGPVVVADDEYHANMNTRKAMQLLKKMNEEDKEQS